MGTVEKAVLVAVVLVYVGWRFVRYFRLGMSRRPTGGVPSGAGWIAPLPPDSSQPPSISEPPLPPSRTWAFMRAAPLWAAANVALVYVLFVFSGARGIPPILRLVALVLVNFYLVPFCRRVTTR